MTNLPTKESPMASRAVVLFLASSLLACGGDGPTGPTFPTFPTLAGVYDFSATINEVPFATFSGTLTLIDGARGAVTGTYALTINAGGETVAAFTGDIQGTVAVDGSFTLDLAPDDPGNFKLIGTRNAQGVLSGTWFLRGDPQNFTGSFTAIPR